MDRLLLGVDRNERLGTLPIRLYDGITATASPLAPQNTTSKVSFSCQQGIRDSKQMIGGLGCARWCLAPKESLGAIFFFRFG